MQMLQSETELQMVQRHVHQGRDILVRQRAVVERLQASGFATDQAAALLSEFQNLQAQHEKHLTRLG
jgi:hypothetical protein